MELLSINVGRAQSIEGAGKAGVTGIFKEPVSAPVRVTRLGLEGDAVCDTKNHGGPDQALYLYGAPDYAWWSARLGRSLDPGTFGENLILSDLKSAELHVGDRLHFAEVVLELSAPRIPCATLAARMGDPAFVKRFREAERPGVYCRVLQEGDLRPGETARLESTPGEALSMLELFRTFFEPRLSAATLRRHLAAPIAERDREDKAARLRALDGETP